MDEPNRTDAGSGRSDARSGGKPLKLGVYDRPASVFVVISRFDHFSRLTRTWRNLAHQA